MSYLVWADMEETFCTFSVWLSWFGIPLFCNLIPTFMELITFVYTSGMLSGIALRVKPMTDSHIK